MKSTHWSKKTSKELLATPFSQFLSLKPLPLLEEAIREVCLEVRKKLPHLKLSFYPSDEWFCVDGTTAIAIPFYLYHPRLWELEEKMMGKIEERNKEILKKILRHEIGHAVDNAYHLRNNKMREKLFGPSHTKYPKFYGRKVFSQAYAQNLPLNYAQAHPDEDFAETFATWLNPKVQWKKKYLGKPCYQKLVFMNALMRECKNLIPLTKSRRQYDKVYELSGTLKKFYQRKRKIYLSPLEILVNKNKPCRKSQSLQTEELMHKLTNDFQLPKYQAQAISQIIKKNNSLPLKKVMNEIPRFIEHQFKRIPL